MNKYLVEFLGTTFFIFVILSVGHPVAIGAALALAIMVGGKISGGNFNPAVSVAMLMSNKLSMNDLMFYVLAQVAGGTVAYQLYKRFK